MYPDMISIIVPVYRTEACINQLYRRVVASVGKRFELIFVDDRSPDNSWELIRYLSEIDPRVKGLKLSRNFGQHKAIWAGLNSARGDWIVVMDCDLQDPPEDIPRLLERAVETDSDVVVARRMNRKYNFLQKLKSNSFYKIISFASGMRADPEIGNFRIFSKKVRDAILQMKDDTKNLVIMMNWVGFKREAIDVEHNERFAGTSSYTFTKLCSLAMNTIITFSDKPLFLSFIGSFSFFMASWLCLLFSFLYPQNSLPWLIFAGISFATSLSLFCIGINGLYIAKIFAQTKERPSFILSEESPSIGTWESSKKELEIADRVINLDQ